MVFGSDMPVFDARSIVAKSKQKHHQNQKPNHRMQIDRV